MSSGISKVLLSPSIKPLNESIEPLNESIKPQDESRECNFQKLPNELILKIISHLPNLSDRAKLSEVSRFFRSLAQDPLSWKQLCQQIDKDAPVENYYTATQYILKIYEEAGIIETIDKSEITINKSEITIEEVKELKNAIDDKKISDTIEIWLEIKKQVIADGLTIDFPNFDEMSKKTCNEVLEAFDDWTKKNQDKLSITHLYLSNKELIYLPDSIGNLTNLEFLSLKSNYLQYLPDSIGNLTNLEILYVKNNNLKSLPDSIGNLTNLEILSVEDNNLQYLPDSIGKLTELKYFYADNNNLQYLPDSIYNLFYFPNFSFFKNKGLVIIPLRLIVQPLRNTFFGNVKLILIIGILAISLITTMYISRSLKK